MMCRKGAYEDASADVEYEARASGEALAPGERVSVVEVSGGRLVVEAREERGS